MPSQSDSASENNGCDDGDTSSSGDSSLASRRSTRRYARWFPIASRVSDWFQRCLSGYRRLNEEDSEGGGVFVPRRDGDGEP